MGIFRGCIGHGESEEISDKLDEVRPESLANACVHPAQVLLRRKLQKEDGDESMLSESAQQAVDKVAGLKRRELKAGCRCLDIGSSGSKCQFISSHCPRLQRRSQGRS